MQDKENTKPDPMPESGIETGTVDQEPDYFQAGSQTDFEPENLSLAPEFSRPAPKLPYAPIGRLLWPLIPAILVLSILAVLLNIIRSFGDFDPKIYPMIAVLIFALLSPAFIISGLRDLVNQKARPDLKVPRLPYLLMALPWSASMVYWLYTLTRYAISFLSIIGFKELIYYSIDKFALALLSFFIASIFIMLFIDLKEKEPQI